jgi:hypothetical protein
MSEDDNCTCDNPFRPGHKLFLCGSDLCGRIKHLMVDTLKTTKGFDPERKVIILSEEDKD